MFYNNYVMGIMDSTLMVNLATSLDTVKFLQNALGTASLLKDFILPVLTGIIVGMFLQSLLRKHQSKKDLHRWVEEQFVIEGIDVLVARLDELIFAYSFIKEHKDNDDIHPRDKVSPLIKKPFSKEFLTALSRLQTMTGVQGKYESAMAVLDDKRCQTINLGEVHIHDNFAKSFRKHLLQLKEVLIKIDVASKAKALAIVRTKVDAFREEQSAFYKELDDFVSYANFY